MAHITLQAPTPTILPLNHLFAARPVSMQFFFQVFTQMSLLCETFPDYQILNGSLQTPTQYFLSSFPMLFFSIVLTTI